MSRGARCNHKNMEATEDARQIKDTGFTFWKQCIRVMQCMRYCIVTAGHDSEAVDTAQPARQAAVAGRPFKKKKGGKKPGPKPKHAASAAGATAAGATITAPADYYGILELDDDFVLKASSSGACTADVTQMPAWACAAGKIRLLARQQAQHSAAAAQSSEAEAETEQQLALSGKVAQMEQQEMPGEVPADEIAKESIAKAKGMLAEFKVLHSKILS